MLIAVERNCEQKNQLPRYEIHPQFWLGDVAYGISQRRIKASVPCPNCGGKGEVEHDGCPFYCKRCYGSGVDLTPVSKWFVDEEPMTIVMIRASISSSQIVYKYKGKSGGMTCNRSNTTLFATLQEAKAECDKRNNREEELYEEKQSGNA